MQSKKSGKEATKGSKQIKEENLSTYDLYQKTIVSVLVSLPFLGFKKTSFITLVLILFICLYFYILFYLYKVLRLTISLGIHNILSILLVGKRSLLGESCKNLFKF